MDVKKQRRKQPAFIKYSNALVFVLVCLCVFCIKHMALYSVTLWVLKAQFTHLVPSLLPVHTLATTGTTGAADPQLHRDNKTLPPAPVNTIFACFYFHQLLLFFKNQPGLLDFCQVTMSHKHILLM